jgi:hypothetical protein
MNKLNYKVIDPKMAVIFDVDSTGEFKIKVPLTASLAIDKDGFFSVLIQITDLNLNTEIATVIVQLTNFVKENKCPKILDDALCNFTINQTTFDKSKL